MIILVVNVGSSSHKISLFDLHNLHPVEPLWKAVLDWGRVGHMTLSIATSGGKTLKRELENNTIPQAVEGMIQNLWQGDTKVIDSSSDIGMVGHRVVHGGMHYVQPTLITPEIKNNLRELNHLAPLHNPGNLEGIELMEKFFPKIPQIAVFDTSFHATMPVVTKTYPIPIEWEEEGIQRYGFHGISHHYCADRAATMLNKDLSSLKIINCHLGNGSSLCAIKHGISVDTSMGMTPMEGLMMGTRSGSIDPGIILYLMREKLLSVEFVDKMLNDLSGLKGIAGTSDMRDLVSRTDPFASLAFEMYVYRLRGYIGSYFTHLGGIDVLSFTAGIGEHSAALRAAACKDLTMLGIELDHDKNALCTDDQDISLAHSKVRVLVIHTKEEWMIAKKCFEMEKTP